MQSKDFKNFELSTKILDLEIKRRIMIFKNKNDLEF
jgi:hypothetical protein